MAVKADGGTCQYVVFKIGDEDFGADIHKVTTIERVLPTTRVPKTPNFVNGVVNLRGEIIPIIDLRKRLGFDAVDHTEDTRTIVVRNGEVVAGFIVDSVAEVIELKYDSVESCEIINSGIASNFITGVGKSGDRILTLLNFDELTQLN